MRTFGLLLTFTLASICLGAEQDPALTSQDNEPTYKGRSLAQWIIVAENEDRVSRIEAVASLGRLGPAAVPALIKLLKDRDAEFRRAVAEILWELGSKDETSIPTLLELFNDQDGQARWPAGETARMVAFLADREGKQGCDFPAWIEYRKIVGDTPASRQLFGDMLTAEPELCAGIGGDAKRLGELLALRVGVSDDSDSIRRGRYKAGLGNIAAVFFVAARPDVAPFFHDDLKIFHAVDRILRHSSSSKCLRANWGKPDPECCVIQKLVNRWVMLEGDPKWITIHLELAGRFGLKDAFDPLALRSLHHSECRQISGHGGVDSRAVFVLLTARRLDKKEDRRFFAPYLERAAPLGYQFRPQLRQGGVDPQLLHVVDPQLRDFALGVLVELSGQKPEVYGFLEYQTYDKVPVYLFQTMEQRNQGFALCIKNYKELGLERPPKYTPEIPPRFCYAKDYGELRSSPTSPDGKTRLDLRGKKARLIDVATGNPIGKELDAGVWEGPNSAFTFTCYSFSPDGKYVVTGSSFVKKYPREEDTRDTNVGHIEVWDAATGERVEKKIRGATGSVRAVGFSSDGKVIYYDADNYSHDVS